MTRRIFITVAEVSGDKHAAQLIRELRELDPHIMIEGLGGPEMEEAGAVIHRNTVLKAAMGWRGLLRAIEVYKLLKWTGAYFDANRPDLWIGVDSPSMNFHFARLAHDRGVPTLQYVAPQLWAWALWRMKKLRRWVDQVACILPFEEKFFGDHGVHASFVGHPLFDELPPRLVKPPGERFPNRPPVIGLLAGSRKSEAQANFPGMLSCARQIRHAFPAAVFLAPTTPATHPIVTGLLADDRCAAALDVEVGLNRFDEMVPRCDLCLTVSGTATLHVASFNVPMIVVYRVSKTAWNLAGRWLVPTRTIALVNVLAKDARTGDVRSRDGHIVPEFMPWSDAGEAGDLALEMLENPEKLAAQREKLHGLIASLDQPGASRKVAAMALEMIRRSGSRSPGIVP
ncbi:MAG TPA: hypothetical protein VG326_09965 [Tepidisphaeraceae bacterium]|jgi:lipid-A-disaccharide synthase|nr:hypothetical protein [Tepidisphaeraceae bacterium]